jgi:hypothetical protein
LKHFGKIFLIALKYNALPKAMRAARLRFIDCLSSQA